MTARRPARSWQPADTQGVSEADPSWGPVHSKIGVVEQRALQKLCLLSNLCFNQSHRDTDLGSTLSTRSRLVLIAARDTTYRTIMDAVHHLTATGTAGALHALLLCKEASDGTSETVGPMGKELLVEVLRDLRDISATRILLSLPIADREDAPRYRQAVADMVAEVTGGEHPTGDNPLVADIFMGYHQFMSCHNFSHLQFLSNSMVRKVLEARRNRQERGGEVRHHDRSARSPSRGPPARIADDTVEMLRGAGRHWEGPVPQPPGLMQQPPWGLGFSPWPWGGAAVNMPWLQVADPNAPEPAPESSEAGPSGAAWPPELDAESHSAGAA